MKKFANSLPLLLLLLKGFINPDPVSITTETAHWHAVPPSPIPLTVDLPDGSQLQIVARGNDHQHWTETTDGYTILRNEEGYYEYAVQRNGQLVSSGIRASDPEKRPLSQMRRLVGIAKHLAPATDHLHEPPQLGPQSSRQQHELQAAVPSKGQLRILAICIEYPDLPHTQSVDYLSRFFNEGIEGKPSFKGYFLENSYGQLDMTVDVAGWVMAKHNFDYYGEKNGKTRARELVAEALQAVDPEVNFGEYDNDQDGDVDGVIIIHAGPGAEEGGRQEYIWSHRWTLFDQYLDSKFVFDYTIQPETRSAYYGGIVGIGIFCHEFGHLLGLPDLYDTDIFNGESNGIGEWGLMGLGNWLGREDYPAGMSAWCKERLGWIQPQDITGQYGNFSLSPASAQADFFRIETGRSGEYFLLENRQPLGSDAFLNGNGLAVWHIYADKALTYPGSNRVNGDENLKGIDLEEADGLDDLDHAFNRGDAGDLYPGSTNKRDFNFLSTPSSNSYFFNSSSQETGISIDNIREEEDGTIRFTHSRLFSDSGEG